MSAIKAILVDDETHARKMLGLLLAEADVEVEILAEASSAEQAIELLKTESPDVIFLDIDMAGINGIQMAELAGDNRSFEIIFITGHKEHATKAFRVNALDYILKPIAPRELEEALNRLVKKLGQKAKPVELNGNKIALPMSSGFELVDLDSILAFRAERAYTAVLLENEEEKLVSKRLKLFENLLESKPSFMRVHRSFLVNMEKVKQYSKSESLLILNNELEAPITKDYKEIIEKYFEGMRP